MYVYSVVFITILIISCGYAAYTEEEDKTKKFFMLLAICFVPVLATLLRLK